MDRIRTVFLVTLVLILVGVSSSAGAPTAYVVNLADGVSVIDIGTNTVVATVAAGTGPQGVAITPDGRFAYVVNVTSSDVSVINTATNTVVATVAVGIGPFGVAISPNGAFAYVTAFGDRCVNGGVWVIETARNAVVAIVPLAGCTAGVALTPDGAFAYVANNTSSAVTVIDTATNSVFGAPISVGSSPYGVAITADGAFVYVTHSAMSGTSANSVSVIDTAAKTVATTVAVGAVPQGVAITPDGAFAYVANSQSNDVSVIETATNTVASTVAVGVGPSGVAFTPNGAFAYVTNSNSDSVSVIDTAARSVVATVPVETGAGPRGIAIADVPSLDTTPPDTSILSGPAEGSFTNSTEATFTFAGTDDRTDPALLTFTCSLDGGASAPCAASQTYSNLAEGQHTFAVSAVDGAGNVDPTPATRTWTIDTTPPIVFISVTPQVLWPPNHQLVEVTVAVSAGDQANVVLSKVECSEPAGVCAGDDIQGADIGTLDTTILLRSTRTGGSERTYTLTYQATDLAGNTVTASATVVVPAKSP